MAHYGSGLGGTDNNSPIWRSCYLIYAEQDQGPVVLMVACLDYHLDGAGSTPVGSIGSAPKLRPSLAGVLRPL